MIATISIQLPVDAVDALRDDLRQFLQRRGIDQRKMLLFTMPLLQQEQPPRARPRLTREDYMKYLCEHRDAIKVACYDVDGVKSYNLWPIRLIDDCETRSPRTHWVPLVLKRTDLVTYTRPDSWCSRFDIPSKLSDRLRSSTLSTWFDRAEGVIYASVSFDPLDRQWKAYVGQTRSLTARWNTTATSTTHSHQRGIWEILHAVLNAREDLAPRDLLSSSFQLCDLAYAASIVDYFANKTKEGGVWLFLCEELTPKMLVDKKERDALEQKWIAALKPEYNIRLAV